MKSPGFNIPLFSRFICILGFCFWCIALSIKYYSFGFYDWDLALYSQTMWALCHGTTTTSLFGTSFLADHAHFIAFLITPIYFFLGHPLTLLYLEVLSFFVGAYVLYTLAEKLTSPGTAFVLMAIYILHPANIFMLLYEFHFESLAIALIFLLFYFHHLENYKGFLITAVFLMLVKENMPAIVFMIGIYGLLFKPAGRIKWGLIPLALGLGMFILTMFVIMPMVRQNLPTHQSTYWIIFSAFGKTPDEILKNLLLNPGIFIKQLATLKNLYFIKDILGGFLPAAIFSPAILLIGTPILLENLLSNHVAQHTIFYHYTATLVPFASIAAVYTFSYFKKHHQQWSYRVCLAFCLLITACSLHNYSHLIQNRVKLCIPPNAGLRQAIIDKIPPDAGVISSIAFLSQLSQRQNLYALYNVWMNINYFTGQHPFIVPSTVHYAIIDYNEPFVISYSRHPQVVTRIKNFLEKGGWKIKSAQSGIVLYER